MIYKEDLKKVRESVNLIESNFGFYWRALMFLEFESQTEHMNDELIAFLIEVAYEAYEDTEYSTPTGTGMAMWHFLEDEENYQYILEIDFDKNGVFFEVAEKFSLYYSNSEWR